MTDSVDTDELRALVSAWRMYAEAHTGPGKSNFEQCAKQLEELIDDE